jgi:hypothetical protein
MKFTVSMRSKLSVLIYTCVGLSFGAAAQFNNLSPYSRFGIGDLYNGGNVGTLGLGGVSSTYNDTYMLNAENPATVGNLFNTSLQTSIRTHFLRINEGDRSSRQNTGNLDQFQMAFKRPGSPTGYILGISPISTTGYAISTTQNIDGVGQVQYIYEGRGGINKAFIGFGRKFDVTKWQRFTDKDGLVTDSVKVKKHTLSGGLNLNYYFGNVVQSRLVNIQNTTYLGTRATDNFRLFDFGADFGVHYETLLKARYGRDRKMTERLLLQVGAVYTPALEMNTTIEKFSESVIFQQGAVFPIDTSFSLVGDGTSSLPSRMRGGVALHYHFKGGRHILVAADLEVREWSNFRTQVNDAELNPGLLNTTTLGFGIQFTPRSVEEGKNLLDRAQYRLGYRSSATYLAVDGEQVIDQALTAGISFPIVSSRSASKIHFGMEFGNRGKNTGNMIEENYVNAVIGFTLSPFFKNAWFVQRKYD